MTKIYKLNEIEITEDQVRQLIKDNPELLKKKGGKPWRAEGYVKYYFVTPLGEIEETNDVGGSYDNYLYLTGNYFATQEQALAYKARQEAIGRVTHKILELSDGEYKDFNNHYWGIFAKNNEFMSKSTPMGEYYAPILPHIASREIAEQIIKDHEADLKIIFNIK